MIWTEKGLGEIVELQDKAAKALSNFLLAVHAREWTDLPPPMVTAAKKILTDAQRPIFFSN